MTTKKINILFGTQEYYIQAGGIGSVTVDLPPALVKHGCNVAVVTPFFDAYNDFYKNKHVEYLTSIQHIYNEKPVKSDIFRVCTNVIDGQPIYHYLIKPEKNSPIGWLFNIENNGANIYQSFEWSEKGNRNKYFNSAVAAMLRMPDAKIPEFDVYHSHAWHTTLSGVLAKEMDTLPKWQNILQTYNKPAKKTPYMISTIHAVRDTGQINAKHSVSKFLVSTGLPADFTKYFPQWKTFINTESLKQAVLGLLYSDHVTVVSEGLAHEIAHTKSEQKLDQFFAWLESENRLQGILNGIDHAKFDCTSKQNLHDLAIDPESVTASKRKIKEYLHNKYPQLDPNKMWFNFIGRFAIEKGVDMLPHALEAISKEDGIFIIMGRHIVKPTIEDGKTIHRYGALLNELRMHPNVLVIDDPSEQAEVGAYIRAASDCVTMLSHDEPCGLPQIEGFANGAFAVASNVQGLPESVKDFADNPEFATGFLYSDDLHTRNINLEHAIRRAAQFYREQNKAKTLDSYLKQLLVHSKQFDWNASSATKYTDMYKKVLQRPMLRLDQIRAVPKPLLSSLDNTKQLEKDYGPRPQHTTTIKHNPTATPIKAVSNNSGKIFVIGFNKCGTETLHYGFADNGILSTHYGPAKRTHASVVYENFKANRKLLTGIEKYKVYSDLEDIYYPERPLYPFIEFFMLLDRQYPGSTFILNTRDKDKWIKSRMSHRDPVSGLSYPFILSARYQISEDELVARWSKEWDDHHKAVRTYFKDRPNDFIEYNLETNTPQDLCDFFPQLNLDPQKFRHRNKTNHAAEVTASSATSSVH